MAATLTSTGITFSDGTSLNTAFPSAQGVGAYTRACYTATAPAGGADGTPVLNNYGAGTTTSGGSLAINMYYSPSLSGSVGGYTSQYIVCRSYYPGKPALGFPGSGSGFSSGSTSVRLVSAENVGGLLPTTIAPTGGGSMSYGTASGSWRSMEPFSIIAYYDGYYNNTNASWRPCLWQRYA